MYDLSPRKRAAALYDQRKRLTMTMPRHSPASPLLSLPIAPKNPPFFLSHACFSQ